MGTRYHTVVELLEFVRAADHAGMNEQERSDLIDLLALNPDVGASLGGGLYKVRFARKGRGKSGGFRVIYFYREEDLPIFLVTAFAKNRKSNITAKERADLVEDCRRIAEQYRSRT